MSQTKAVKRVNTPHDKGYKKSLSNPKEFLHFLQKYIGEEWMIALSETQLALCDKEFIEKDYEGKEADLLYKVTRKDGQEVFIFILQELQSYVDQTMIFRLLIYIVNTLLRHFLAADKNVRETVGFRLPAVVPIVFYNGSETWTAVRDLKEYQGGYEFLGEHILNLEYYFVDLSKIKEEYILSTNTVLDNIMYCDKFRRKQELVAAVRKAYGRVRQLGAQEREEFHNWVRYILLSVCDNKEAVVEEIMAQAENGDDNMAFEYTIIREFNKEREKVRREAATEGRMKGRKEGIIEGRKEGRKEGKIEGRKEGKIEGRKEGRIEGKIEGKIEATLELLEDLGEIPEELEQKIREQKDLDILKKWHKFAASVSWIEEFEEKIANYTTDRQNLQ